MLKVAPLLHSTHTKPCLTTDLEELLHAGQPLLPVATVQLLHAGGGEDSCSPLLTHLHLVEKHSSHDRTSGWASPRILIAILILAMNDHKTNIIGLKQLKYFFLIRFFIESEHLDTYPHIILDLNIFYLTIFWG